MSLAAVPVCIAECRSVRIIGVLDASPEPPCAGCSTSYGCRLGNAWVTAAVRLDTCSLP